MGIKDRRLKWLLALTGLALLPLGMTAAVMRSLAQVRAAGEQRPRVVAAWPSGPMEVRVAFDRPVDPSVIPPLAGQAIPFADANERTDRPAVGGRPGGNGGSIRIAAARLDEARRTLILVTDPHPVEATYQLALNDLKGAGVGGKGRAEAVSYTLSGVEATWTPEGAAQPEWSGWLPEVDPARARVTLAGSVDHDRLWPLLSRSGTLALRSFVQLPAGPMVATITSKVPGEVTLGSATAHLEADRPATLALNAEGQPAELTATLTTRVGGPTGSSLRWQVAPEGTKPEHAPTLSRWAFGLPWAPQAPLIAPVTAFPETLANGGDPTRGAVVFAGETARCATCHQVRGQGGQVGPDLSNLHRASRAWVYSNIVEPSAAIHPNYLSYTVALKDGRVAMGTVRADGADGIRVSDNDAKVTTYPRIEVEELRPSASSIMPVGLLQALGDERTRDLLAYLTEPPAVGPSAAPAPSPAAAPRP